MPRVDYQQVSFTSGELSPRLEGRTDLERYASGVRDAKNCITLAHGPAVRRPGLYYVADCYSHTKKSVLVPFEFSVIQAYIVEFADQKIRFYMNGGQILDAGNPYEIASTYLEANLFQLRFAQSADVLYIVHPSYAPRKLTRTGHTNWTLSEVDFIDGPYFPENTDAAKTLTPSATTGTITLTATGFTFHETGHVGSLWRMTHGATTGYVKITAVAGGGGSATAIVRKTLGGTAATEKWREGRWSIRRGFPGAVSFHEERLYFAGATDSPQTLNGSVAGLYEDMTPGANADDAVEFTLAANQVNTIHWLSPVTELLVGSAGGEHRIYAKGDEPITPSTINVKGETVWGARNISPVRAANATLFATRSGRKVRELRYSIERDSFDANDISILAEHLFPRKTSVTQLAFAKEPDPIVWMVRSDGVLVGLTYEPGQDVRGFHHHETDGAFESVAVIPHPDGDHDQVWAVVRRTIGGATKRFVERFDAVGLCYDQLNTDSTLIYDGTKQVALTLSAATLGAITVTAASNVFVAEDVGKEIHSGYGKATITAFSDEQHVSAEVYAAFASTTLAAGAWRLAVTSVSGLGHLEGKTVAIVGDGAVYPNEVVTSGAVTLKGSAAGRIEVGLPYTSRLLSLSPDVKTQSGTAAHKQKRWNEINVYVYDTLGILINGDQPSTRTPADPMGFAPPLYTGQLKAVNLGHDAEGRWEVRQELPLPMTVLKVTGSLGVGD